MRRELLCVLALAAALVGCTGGVTKPRPAGPAGRVLAPRPTPAGDALSYVTTTVVSDAGGTVAAPDGGLSIGIPDAAVATSVAITVLPIVNMARGAVGPAYRLGPEGTTFAAPVTLTFPAPATYPMGTSLAGVGVAYQDADGFWHAVEPVTRDPGANTVSVTTTHFSDWALVWAGGTAAAEGPITLVQTLGSPWAIPFTATGTATIYFLSDDASDTAYNLTGTLTVQDPTIQVGGATCVPEPRTRTLSLNVAEAHKSTPPVFRWGLGGHWTLTCDDGQPRVLPAAFDTMGIAAPACAGEYEPGQVVSPDGLGGAFRKDCGADGLVRASWSLCNPAPDQPCSTGVDCRLGVTTCTAGVPACADAGPAPDPTPCGTTAWTCISGVCTPPP